MLKNSLSIFIALLIALGGGIWSVRWVLDNFDGFGALHVGQWSAYPASGTANADPYAKARDARKGTLSPGLAESLTFYAHRSLNGQELNRDCTYQLSGPTPPARFWTVYAASTALEALDPGKGFQPALHAAEMLRKNDNSFTLTIGGQAAPGNWLPVKGQGPYVLVMVFYDTPAASSAGLSDLAMPQITRLSGKGKCNG